MLFIGLTFFPKVIYIIYLGVIAFMLMSTAATVTVRMYWFEFLCFNK